MHKIANTYANTNTNTNMEQMKRNLLSTVMYHIINKYDWEKAFGHYVYYKENTKKPSKKLLQIVSRDKVRDYIYKIEKGFDIEDQIFENKKKQKKIKQIENDDDDEVDTTNYIQLCDNYKFQGINPYDD